MTSNIVAYAQTECFAKDVGLVKSILIDVTHQAADIGKN
jgi:hypothetical protein